MLHYIKNFDNDAVNFIDALVSLTEAQRIIINDLVKNLKNAGIWDKMYAIYPVIGGTEACHKFNLKDPRDDNAAYRLAFSGTITHSATGMTGNGTTGYYNTNLNDNTVTELNNVSLWVYSRLDLQSNGYSIYVDNNNIRERGTTNYFLSFCHTSSYGAQLNYDSRGLFGNTRFSSDKFYLVKNSTLYEKIIPSSVKTNSSYLGMKYGSIYGINEQAFVAIGQGLSIVEVPIFYAIIQAYQTSLNRQV